MYIHVFVLFQKTKPDDVSKLALSKAKDWKYILQQVRILLICILYLKFTVLVLTYVCRILKIQHIQNTMIECLSVKQLYKFLVLWGAENHHNNQCWTLFTIWWFLPVFTTVSTTYEKDLLVWLVFVIFMKIYYRFSFSLG